MAGRCPRRAATAGAALVLLCICIGCAYPPAVLDTGPYALVDPAQAARIEPAHERVRWGGAIAETHPGDGETCVDVIALPLDSRARPRPTDASLGRFRACAPGFYDPGIYASGRRVTVVGAVVDRMRTNVGEYALDVPIVAAEVLYLWPEAPAAYLYTPYPPYPYLGPAWGWGLGYGWPYAYGIGPSWGRPFYGFSGRFPPPPPRKLN